MEEILLILVVQNLVDSFSGCREKCFSIFIYMKHLKLWRFETILLFFMKREGEKVRNTSKSCIISRCELLMVGTTDFQLTQFYTIITSQSPKQSSSKKDSWSPECVGSQNLKITCSENAWNFNLRKFHVVNFGCSTVLNCLCWGYTLLNIPITVLNCLCWGYTLLNIPITVLNCLCWGYTTGNHLVPIRASHFTSFS